MVIKHIASGATSKVYYDDETNTISKQVLNYQNYSTFEREVYWLLYLNKKGYGWCPKLLSADPKTKIIEMEYVGEKICRDNAPKNWEAQLLKILAELKKEGIQHNDIKVQEVVVKNDKLYLVDYGWASKGTDWSCGNRFNGRTKPAHIFHDKNALMRIKEAIANNPT